MTLINLILAFLQAVPVLDKWFEDLVTAYTTAQLNQMKSENRDAIAKALLAHDQRRIEELIGSAKAGKPSGIEGTETRDNLPGVS